MRHPTGKRRARRATPTVALVAAFVVCGATAAVAAFGDTSNVGGNEFSTRMLHPPTELTLTPVCGGVTTVDADWTASPSAFASGYRLQRYVNGALDGEQTVAGVATQSASDGPLQPNGEYEYRLFAEYQNWTSSVAVAQVTTHCERHATMLWREDGVATPLVSAWDGAAWSPAATTAPVGQWRIAQAARSETRDELLAVSIDTGNDVRVLKRSDGVWEDAFGSALSTSTSSSWWGVGVAYESSSDDAMVVWNNGTGGTAGLSYRMWDGVAWSAATTITTPLAGEPQQLHLAASPVSDEMVLVASNEASQDFALVWDGSAWGNAIALDGGSGNHRGDVNVSYESRTGRAMVVYAEGPGNPGTDVRYRFWNGTSWSARASLGAPGGLTGSDDTPRWTVVASDPRSNRIAMGVVTEGADTWLAVWSGTAWANLTVASTIAPVIDTPNVAVAFESQSGQALATYGEEGNAAGRYRTWISGTGWSAEAVGLATSALPTTMTLATEPITDQVGYAVLDDAGGVYAAVWNGSAWTAQVQIESDAGESRLQPFTWVWD